MALSQAAGRLLSEFLPSKKSAILSPLSVPLGVAAAVLQASLYDVPGGYQAVMFDRFSGVKDKVSILLTEPLHIFGLPLS